MKSVTDSTVAGRPHGERGGLDDLLEQAVDLGRERGRGGVALLGEVRVAGAAAGERGEQRLVVAEPEADRRGRGDAVAAGGRKLLLEIEVPAMAALGLAQVCELELQWVELATMDTHTITIPVSVNVVPGDEAAGRVPNPTVRTERAFQQAQRDKQAATDALRAGDAPAAAAMYASAAQTLGGYADEEMQAEADVLLDLSVRAQHDDRARTAKFSEADRHRKSRRRR